MADHANINPNINPQFEYNPNIKVPGVDMEALHSKYAKMAKTRDEEMGTNNPELLKNEKFLKQMQASKDKVAMGVPAGKDAKKVNAAESLANTPMPKIDNLLICNACAGHGIRKIKYMYQLRDMNCDGCDGTGLIEKVATVPKGLSESEKWDYRKNSIKDVEMPETGDQEMALQKEIMEKVQRKLGGDVQKISEFFQHTRAYGTCSDGTVGGTAHHKYYHHLMDVFDKHELREFLPILARLIKDKDRRLSLLATPLTAEMQGDDNKVVSNSYRSQNENENSNIFKCSSGGKSGQADEESEPMVSDPYTGAPMKVMQKVMSQMDPNGTIEQNMAKVQSLMNETEEGGDDDCPSLE